MSPLAVHVDLGQHGVDATVGSAASSSTINLTVTGLSVGMGDLLPTDVLDALGLMTKRRIRHLPVVEAGQIRGIVSIGDLVKYRMERIEAEAEAMRTYIQSA